MQIVYGKGVATPSGIANTIEKRFNFEVREPFAVSFTCEREHAQATFLPLRPMELRFNAPVSRTLASQIDLKGGGKTIKPKIDEDNAISDDSVIESIEFAAPFPEKTPFIISLPAKFQDASGRPLASPDSFPMKTASGLMPPFG